MADFSYTIPITRAYKENGKMFLEGTASTIEVDSYNTIFSEECQEGFVRDILDGLEGGEPVLVEAEHLSDQCDIYEIGWTVDGCLNEQRTDVRLELDSNNPIAISYYNKMTIPDPKTKRTKQYGLSINGCAVRSHYNNEGIRVFDEVKLRKIGIVRSPSNPSAYIKSIIRSVEKHELNDNLSNEEGKTQMKEKATEVLRDEADTSALDEVGTEQETPTEQEVRSDEKNLVELTEEVKRGILMEQLDYLLKQERMDQVFDALECLIRLTQDSLRYAKWEDDPTGAIEAIMRDFNDAFRMIMTEQDVTTNLAMMEDRWKELEYRAMVDENTAALQQEDVSEDTTETRSDEQEVVKAEPEKSEEFLTRAEAVDVLTKVVELQSDELKRSNEELKNTLTEKDKTIEELQRGLQEVLKRVEVLETQPATSPGVVLHTEEKQEAVNHFREAIKRGDAQSAIKYAILGIKPKE